MKKTVAIIGGGVAGLAAAASLNTLGYQVMLFEKEISTGGNVAGWDRLFPSGRKAMEVIDGLKAALNGNAGILQSFLADRHR